MRKLSTCIFAMMVCAPACFASGVVASRAVPSSGASESLSVSSRSASDSRTAVSRTTSRQTTVAPSANDTKNTIRSTVSRVFTGAPATPSTARTRNVQSRTNVITRSVSGNRTNASARSGLDAAVNTVGRNSRVSSASINSNPAVRRAGLVLRPSTAEVGGRAIIGDTGLQTGSNISDDIRRLQSRAGKDTTRESIADATARLEETATLNKSCQEQYNECMDQFCAVIDANQKRCSCSANLSRYTKVETAVKDANAQLNEVAQRIRYVGLSADEIRAIMTQTEAEAALSGTVDTSETRNMLDQIEDLIRDPSAGTTYSSDTYSGFDLDLDLDFDFSSDSDDLFSLDFLTGNSGDSFSNLRGSDLYNAAKKRCKNILNECKDAGATPQQITGNYDLAIDKDCIAYEQGLSKMNETLLSNVRSANRMLQKARLSVLQNKNQYDAKACIGALETCMKDEMVCGENYFKCVDPTKRYIDENGDVVLGQNISNINAFMENYNNAAINDAFLENAYKNQNISEDACKNVSSEGMGGNDGSCVAKYLLQKIGTKSKVTDEGLCRAVLDKCQRYTYNSNDVYEPYNDVVVNYVQRAMVNIKAAQQNIISDYASSCMVDVAECYNKQVTQVNAWSSSANVSSVYNVMRGACRNVALTCAYAVFDGSNNACKDDNTCINSISEMFYQSLLCPDNSTYQSDAVPEWGANSDNQEYVNSNCKCNSGYEPFGGQCLAKCDTAGNETRNSYGTCVCQTGYTRTNGTCRVNNNGVTGNGSGNGNDSVIVTPLPPVPGTDDTSDNISWCNKEKGLWYGLRMCSELGANETEYPTCSIEGFTSETCTNNCYPGAEYCAEKCGNFCNDETPQYDRQCIMYDKYPCEDRNENYSYVSSLCPSTDEIVAEWRKKGYTWEVIRKIYDGNQCHVIVKIPDESGGLCFSIGVSEIYEDWMHSTPDKTTGFPTTGNYKSSWPTLTHCDATWGLGHDRYHVNINNDDVTIPESGYEILEWYSGQPYFYTGINTNQYHLSDPVEFENFGQTGENITCKKQQLPNLDTWIKAIEEQNPDYCFLGVGTTPNPSNGAKLFWDTHGAPCVVAPSYTTKPAGQGKNSYEDVYMWWGTRSTGGCSQTYECTDANKPDEDLSFKDYPVCEE